MTGAMSKFLRQAGSHTVTLWLLGASALVVVTGLAGGVRIHEWIIYPAAGLFLNLVAALVAHASLRAKPMLYAFHATLALFVALIVADDLTSLRGRVEVTTGTRFDPALAEVEAAPLHPYALDEVAFEQGGFEIRYLPGMKRRETFSTVRVPSRSGDWEQVVVGDDNPLVVGEYRFYTTFNKGFAPIVTYTNAGGRATTGSIHMPSYPLNDYQQGNEWTPPGGAPLSVWLSIGTDIYDPDAAWRFRLPEDPVLVVIEGPNRRELRQGESVSLKQGGELRFDSLTTWMGYTISSNLFSTWIMAVAIAAALALLLHVWTVMVTSETDSLGDAEACNAR